MQIIDHAVHVQCRGHCHGTPTPSTDRVILGKRYPLWPVWCQLNEFQAARPLRRSGVPSKIAARAS